YTTTTPTTTNDPPQPDYVGDSPDDYDQPPQGTESAKPPSEHSSRPAEGEVEARLAVSRTDSPDWREPLQAAAAKMLSAREVLYPVTIHLLDISFLDETTMAHGWPAAFEFGI